MFMSRYTYIDSGNVNGQADGEADKWWSPAYRFIEENHPYKLAQTQEQHSRPPDRGGPSQDLMTYWGTAAVTSLPNILSLSSYSNFPFNAQIWQADFWIHQLLKLLTGLLFFT
jgi:hypothetical protein